MECGGSAPLFLHHQAFQFSHLETGAAHARHGARSAQWAVSECVLQPKLFRINTRKNE
jgi:hypothetical protein